MQYECRDNKTIERNFRFPSNIKKGLLASKLADRTKEGNDDEEQVDDIE